MKKAAILAYPSSEVECGVKRRAIHSPIAYKPELTRCTHEASEAVSRLGQGLCWHTR